MNRRRLLPLVLCLVSGVLAASLDVAHTHKAPERETEQCGPACADTRLHYSGHSTEDISKPQPPCTACMLRTSMHRAPERVEYDEALGCGERVVIATLGLCEASAPLNATVRAPPCL